MIVQFKNVTVRLGGNIILSDINWEIRKNENWAIIGPNGAGKSTLAKAIMNKVPVVAGDITQIRDSKIGYVSFDLHDWMMEEEELREKSREFSSKINQKTSVSYIIGRTNKLSSKTQILFDSIVKLLDIQVLISKKLHQLSSGEMRKILIARALIKKPLLLILDEPFEGLDKNSRILMIRIIEKLINNNIKVVFITHNFKEIPPSVTHVLVLKNGKILKKGEKIDILPSSLIAKIYNDKNSVFITNSSGILKNLPAILVDMKNVTVKYENREILKNINWKMRKGDNWLILGDNGAGKSTFLKLITGETLQVYANNITIFGMKKGNGETHWQIKKHIGIVSPELQVQYSKKTSVIDVIISGFFDSVGVIQTPTSKQAAQAQKWVKLLNLEQLVGKTLGELSSGQQRLVLIARALVKQPRLLILDEPCQGLDITNKKHILDIIDRVPDSLQLLYVTHHQDEIPKRINKIARLENGKLELISVN